MTIRRALRLAWPCLSLTLAAACGDDGGDGGGGSSIEPTFTSIYENVLSDEDLCLSCHDSGASSEFFMDLYAQGGELDFSSKQVAYDLLVGQAADGDECDGVGTLVVPGDPDASILVSKVEDVTPVCGDPMPFLPTGPDLTAAQAEAIREWVRLGAMKD